MLGRVPNGSSRIPETAGVRLLTAARWWKWWWQVEL